MRTAAIIGVPASGKTTLMLNLLQKLPYEYDWEWRPEGSSGAKLYGSRRKGNLHVLGLYDGSGTFQGTDRLSMSVQKTAEAWLKRIAPSNVLFEGDRLGCESFLNFCAGVGDLRVFCLEPPADVLAARRSQRTERGEVQTEVWLRGRTTKVNNLIKRFAAIPLPWDDCDTAASIVLSWIRH